VREVIQAAYSAFESGLHAALYASAVLALAAGVFSFVVLGRGESEVPGSERAAASPPA
jgi:hypothetical protein